MSLTPYSRTRRSVSAWRSVRGGDVRKLVIGTNDPGADWGGDRACGRLRVNSINGRLLFGISATTPQHPPFRVLIALRWCVLLPRDGNEVRVGASRY